MAAHLLLAPTPGILLIRYTLRPVPGLVREAALLLYFLWEGILGFALTLTLTLTLS